MFQFERATGGLTDADREAMKPLMTHYEALFQVIPSVVTADKFPPAIPIVRKMILGVANRIEAMDPKPANVVMHFSQCLWRHSRLTPQINIGKLNNGNLPAVDPRQQAGASWPPCMSATETYTSTAIIGSGDVWMLELMKALDDNHSLKLPKNTPTPIYVIIGFHSQQLRHLQGKDEVEAAARQFVEQCFRLTRMMTNLRVIFAGMTTNPADDVERVEILQKIVDFLWAVHGHISKCQFEPYVRSIDVITPADARSVYYTHPTGYDTEAFGYSTIHVIRKLPHLAKFAALLDMEFPAHGVNIGPGATGQGIR